MKIIAASFAVLIVLLCFSPQAVYWWGLSNLDNKPVASENRITPEQELEIWQKEFGVGTPRVEPVTPYGYLFYIYCNVDLGLRNQECESRYPGLRVSSFAVKYQVADGLRGKMSSSWQVTWMAYTIWATRSWDIHQILATYHEKFQPLSELKRG